MFTARTKHCTVKETAVILKCTEGWVRTLLQQGRLKGLKINEKAWLVKLSSVREYQRSPREVGNPEFKKNQ